jgi:hypothetical protein
MAPQHPISASSSTNSRKRYFAGAAKWTKKAEEALRTESTLPNPWDMSGFKKYEGYNKKNALDTLLKVDSWTTFKAPKSPDSN